MYDMPVRRVQIRLEKRLIDAVALPLLVGKQKWYDLRLDSLPNSRCFE